ncbi:MAG: LysE family transporter [Candidatus Promineofilum sp.]|nr:LysE family transporter [Promineifilum sp.]
MLPLWLQGLVLGATAAAQPGPFQAFLLSLITRDGWRATLPAAFAPLVSDGPILILVLLVLTRIPDWALSALQVAGGVFLLYLAWGAWRSFRRGSAVAPGGEAAVVKDIRANVLRAALMNFLSPSPYIFWATVAGPILIEAWRIRPAHGAAFLLGFYATLVGGLMLFIIVFAGAGQIDSRVNRALGLLSAVGLLVFGVYQLAMGSNGLGATLFR